MRPAIDPSEAGLRLSMIFPRAAFDTVMSNPLSGLAVAAMIYVDAVCSDDETETFWARPSTIMWMSAGALQRREAEERIEWRDAAMKSKKKLQMYSGLCSIYVTGSILISPKRLLKKKQKTRQGRGNRAYSNIASIIFVYTVLPRSLCAAERRI